MSDVSSWLSKTSLLDLLRFYKAGRFSKILNDKSVQGCSKRDLLLPIPWREVSINPSGMYQNDGY